MKTENLPTIKKEDKKIELIKSKFAKGATKEEFDLLLYMAEKYQLDILTRQIQFVKYKEGPAQIFCGRDGFLSIAHRSGQFNGMNTEIGIENDEVFALCNVYRKDMEHPFQVKVYLSEYYKEGSPGKKNIWNEKPKTMIAKVAESQCLRKAFDISGIYDPDEMPNIEIEKPVNEKPIEVEKEFSEPIKIHPMDDIPDNVKLKLKEYFEMLGVEITKKKANEFCKQYSYNWFSIFQTLEKNIQDNIMNKMENENIIIMDGE